MVNKKTAKPYATGAEAKAAHPVEYQAGRDAHKERKSIGHNSLPFGSTEWRAFQSGWCDVDMEVNPARWQAACPCPHHQKSPKLACRCCGQSVGQ